MNIWQRLIHWRVPLRSIGRLIDAVEDARRTASDDPLRARVAAQFEALAYTAPGPIRDELFNDAGLPDPLVLREAYIGRCALPHDRPYTLLQGIAAHPQPAASTDEVRAMLQAVLDRILDGEIVTA